MAASRPVPDLLERLRAKLASGGRRRAVLVTLVAILVVLLIAVVWSLSVLAPDTRGGQISLSELRDEMTSGDVTSVTFLDEDAVLVGRYAGGGAFWASYPKSDVLTALLADDLTLAGADVSVDPQTGKGRVRLILTVLLPLMILADLFALFLAVSRGGSDGIGEVIDFGKVGDPRRGGGPDRVGFGDVAGVEAAEVELREVVEYLQAPDRYDELGANPPKGVLLFGPPGTGKTLLAKAVAGEAGVPFYSVAGAQFVESLVGVGAARVRDLFARVQQNAPAILFIDELDALGRKRGAAGAGGGGSDEREQTLNQLLVEMDGFDTATGVVVMAATNRPDILDPALLRPGRFDRHIHIQPPDLEAREEILKLHARKRPIEAGVDWADLARRTPGFTGADLANVINEAALLAVRAGKRQLGADELHEAVLRVIGGTSSRGHLMTEAERHRVAVHEAGHAVVAAACGRGDDVHRVSIVARGRGLGATGVSERDESTVRSRDQLFTELVMALSGRAAELLVLGDPSTAAEDDVERATELATAIVAKYGMSDEVGVRRLLLPTVDVHLGVEEQLNDLSPELHATFDRAVHALLDDASAQATRLVKAHAQHVDDLTAILLEIETIDGEALTPYLPAAVSNGQRPKVAANATARTRAASGTTKSTSKSKSKSASRSKSTSKTATS